MNKLEVGQIWKWPKDLYLITKVLEPDVASMVCLTNSEPGNKGCKINQYSGILHNSYAKYVRIDKIALILYG